MSLVRWDPFSDFDTFFNRMMPRGSGGWPRMQPGGDGGSTAEWSLHMPKSKTTPSKPVEIVQ